MTWTRLTVGVEGSRCVLEQCKSRANGIVDTLDTKNVSYDAKPSGLPRRTRSGF